MGLRFASQLCIDNLPDEQLTDQFEVIMPEMDLIIPDEATMGIDNSTLIRQLSKGFGIYKYRPIVEEISFGMMGFTTATRRIRTGWYQVPTDIETYHDVNIVMFCSAAMTAQHYLDAWKALIFNKRGEYYYPGANYKKNIDVFIYGPGGTGAIGSLIPKTHYTLVGCFPSTQEEYKLEYSDEPKRFRISATFKIDNIIKDQSAAKASIISELVSSPTAILDRGLSSLSGNSEYNINEAYGGKASDSSKSILGKLI